VPHIGELHAFERDLGPVVVAKNFDGVDWYLASKFIKQDAPFTVVTIKPELSVSPGGQGNGEARRVTLSNPASLA